MVKFSNLSGNFELLQSFNKISIQIKMFSQVIESFQQIIASLSTRIEYLYEELDYYKNYYYRTEFLLDSQYNFGITSDHLEYDGYQFSIFELHEILENYLESKNDSDKSISESDVFDDSDWVFSTPSVESIESIPSKSASDR